MSPMLHTQHRIFPTLYALDGNRQISQSPKPFHGRYPVKTGLHCTIEKLAWFRSGQDIAGPLRSFHQRLCSKVPIVSTHIFHASSFTLTQASTQVTLSLSRSNSIYS